MAKVTADRIEDIAGLVKELVECIQREGDEDLERASKQMWAAVEKHAGLTQELEVCQSKAADHREWLESAPRLLAAASLAEDNQREESIRERYKEVKAELESLDERIPEIEKEIAELAGSNAQRLPEHLQSDGCQLYQHRHVANAVRQPLARLALLDKEVSATVDHALDHFKRKAAEGNSFSQEISNRISFDPVMLERRQRRQDEASRDSSRHASSSNAPKEKSSGPFPGAKPEQEDAKRARRQTVRPRITNRPDVNWTRG